MRAILIILTIFFPATVFAGSDINCIWLKHTDNSCSCIMIEENPQFIFEGESIIVDSKSYKIDDILSYRFGNSKDASADNIMDGDSYIMFKNNEIEIHCNQVLDDDVECTIFDTNGIIIKQFRKATTAEPIILDISDLTAGVYFLHFQHSTYKFVKK